MTSEQAIYFQQNYETFFSKKWLLLSFESIFESKVELNYFEFDFIKDSFITNL